MIGNPGWNKQWWILNVTSSGNLEFVVWDVGSYVEAGEKHDKFRSTLFMVLSRQKIAVSFCLPCTNILIYQMLIIKLCPALPGTRCISESISHSFKGTFTTIQSLEKTL